MSQQASYFWPGGDSSSSGFFLGSGQPILWMTSSSGVSRNRQMLWTELNGALLRAQLPRQPLRVPRRAHLGEEAVGFAELTLVRGVVAGEAGQLALLEMDEGS